MPPAEEGAIALFPAQGPGWEGPPRSRVGTPLRWVRGAVTMEHHAKKNKKHLGESLKSPLPSLCGCGGTEVGGSAARRTDCPQSIPAPAPPPAPASGRLPPLPSSRANRAQSDFPARPPHAFPPRRRAQGGNGAAPGRRREEPPELPQARKKFLLRSPLGKVQRKVQPRRRGGSGRGSRVPPASSSPLPAPERAAPRPVRGDPPPAAFHLKEFMTQMKTERELEPRTRDAVMSPGD